VTGRVINSRHQALAPNSHGTLDLPTGFGSLRGNIGLPALCESANCGQCAVDLVD
jgi:hypothetical protein